jgi:serine/threonine protein kinase/actin-like ATPase involved in cell morphogenesis
MAPSNSEDPQHERADDATHFVSDDSDSEFESDDFDLEINESAEATANADLVGVVGEYLLLEQIGAGGMGKVFRAEHRTMNREVALKILSQEIAKRPSTLQQFFAEIRAVAKLMHPNIVTAFDAGSAGQLHYLVMELVNGEVLSSRIRRAGPLSQEEAVSAIVQVGKALEYAHSLGVVHRDIKPSNLILDQEGKLKVLDFGLARISTKGATDSKKKFLMGTPEYMSPEQIENPDAVDGRSDLYSLGATLFYLVTGKPMFSGESMQVARAQLNEEPPALFEARSDLDLRLDSIFQRLIAKDPDHRYDTASEMLKNIEELSLSAELSSGSPLKKGAFRLAKDTPTSAAYGMSTLAKKSQIVCIDLGLLTSTAAYFDPETGPQVIAQGDGNPMYLRNMLWSNGRKVRIGAEASAQRQVDPDKIFHSVQRFIGQEKIQRKFGGELVPPEVILAALIRQVVNNSSEATEYSQSVIVTVPASYGQLHRRAVRTACQIAGVELIQLLDKPLAATLSWLDLHCRLADSDQTQIAADDRVLIVQLSGTGLDASIIHARGTTAKQIGVCGNWKLGQQRWQHLLVQYFSETLKQKTGKDIRKDVAAATRLQRTIEIAMNQLTSRGRVEVRFDWQGASIQQMVTEAGMSKIAPDLKVSIQKAIVGACSMANMDVAEIDRVLVLGSMMRMPSLQKIVRDTIPHDIEVTWLEKTDVARGAAIQANRLSSFSQRSRLSPKAVGCTSYDIAVITEVNSAKLKPRVLIEKGKPTPTSHSRTIRPKVVDGVSSALPELQLIESSGLGSSSWLKLEHADPASLFPERADDEALQLKLDIDGNGILEGSLVRPSSGESVKLHDESGSTLGPEQIGHWHRWLAELMA